MAQEKSTRIRRARALLKRYGILGPKGIVACCVVIVFIFSAIGLARMLGTSSFTIARADDSAASSQEPETSKSPTNDSATSEQSLEDKPHDLLVHVDGAVRKPGVYRLQGVSPRVNDAVELAGGLSEEADTVSLNLAAPIEDGQKIHVPTIGESAATPVATSAGQASVAQGGVTSADESQGLVNINSASEAELQELPGVGEATAAAIVKEREANGPFTSPEDLMRVSGIGEKKYEKMEGSICV